MREMPEIGSLVSYEVIDNFTGESYRVTARVISDGREYAKKIGGVEGYAGIPPGESIAAERVNAREVGLAIVDLVFDYDDIFIIEGPEFEMPKEET